jgi:hypothetical protein
MSCMKVTHLARALAHCHHFSGSVDFFSLYQMSNPTTCTIRLETCLSTSRPTDSKHAGSRQVEAER